MGARTLMRVEHIGDATLYLGDCREVLPTLGQMDAVVTDPPYGMAWNTTSARFTGGHGGKRRDDWGAIAGDAEPFNPLPWLAFRECILWGANHYAARLPVGTTLVWIKRLDPAFGSFLSDAELGWMKGGHGVYCHRDLSMTAEAKDRVHPSQKPVGLMRWCVRKTKADTIIDPYMGSGSTGLAAIDEGRRFIGIELDPAHFATACRRIKAAYRQPRLFAEPPPKPVQPSLLETAA